MHALSKLERPWTDDRLPWKTKSKELPSSLKHVHEQGGKQGRNSNLPSHTFGMGDVKEEKNGRHRLPTYTLDIEDVKEKRNEIEAPSVGTLSALSLLGTLDPYWKSQLLLEYSKNLHTCMILDD